MTFHQHELRLKFNGLEAEVERLRELADSGFDSRDKHIAELQKQNERLQRRLAEAATVIRLYRRWEHASDAENQTGDEADTSSMLIEASFAAQDFVESEGAE